MSGPLVGLLARRGGRAPRHRILLYSAPPLCWRLGEGAFWMLPDAPEWEGIPANSGL